SNTDKVVLDLYWVPLELDGIESSIDLIANMRISDSILEMVLKSKNSYLINSLTLAAINQSLIGYENLRYRENPNLESYISGGFVESKLQQNLVPLEELQTIKPYKFMPSQHQLVYLEKIIDLCES